MIAIKHRFTGATICEFDVKTVKEALALAVSEEIDLSSADLSRAELSRANLIYADLSSANLRSANLRSTDLSRADLSRANLSYADLSSAKIDGEKITKDPLLITGLYYSCLITDGYMRLGCKRYTHAEWSEFNDSEIAAMDSRAIEFWNKWKFPLLAMCKQHAEAA